VGPTIALLIVTGAVAVVDWSAVATDARRLERFAKPLAMLLLVAVAASAGDPSVGVRVWLVTGAVAGLVGDVALLGDGETAFMTGLGAFAVGHVGYAIAAVGVGFSPAWAVPGAMFVTALLGYRFVGRTLPGARAHGGTVLAGAVIGYAAVISAMVITAWATGSVLAALGAMAFAVSDWVLGHRRFVGPLPGGRLAVMIPYHVGQAMLIVGLATR
jgi:uncharacterized membrane protein YhhN